MEFLWAQLMNTFFGWHYLLVPYRYSYKFVRVKFLNERPYARIYNTWYWFVLQEDGSVMAEEEGTPKAYNKKCIPITFKEGDFT